MHVIHLKTKLLIILWSDLFPMRKGWIFPSCLSEKRKYYIMCGEMTPPFFNKTNVLLTQQVCTTLRNFVPTYSTQRMCSTQCVYIPYIVYSHLLAMCTKFLIKFPISDWCIVVHQNIFFYLASSTKFLLYKFNVCHIWNLYRFAESKPTTFETQIKLYIVSNTIELFSVVFNKRFQSSFHIVFR